MLASQKLLRTATLKPILATAVSSETTVQRFIGLGTARFHNVALLSAITEKAKVSSIGGGAAAAANAWLYLCSHNPVSAIEQIDRIAPQIKDPDVLRFAIGVRLRARNELLDIKETALSVSGGSTEAEVSSIRAKVMEDLQIIKEASPKCWLVKLAVAEFLLYTGEIEKALEQFQLIEQEINGFLSSEKGVLDDVASKENSNIYSLAGLRLRQLYASTNNPVNSLVDCQDASNTLKEMQESLQLTLSNEEATELAFALESVCVAHHFQDYFPAETEYDNYASPKALKLSTMIHQYEHPSLTVDLSKIEGPKNGFTGSADDLLNAAKAATESPIKAMRSIVGNTSASSAALADALKQIKAFPVSYECAGSQTFVSQRQEMAKALARQILYRTKIQSGVALLEKESFHEAADVISSVIGANEYIYMWRAFLARSRAYKGLGSITECDKDLKLLKGLKKSITGRTPYEKC